MLKVVSDSPAAVASLIRGCRHLVQALWLIAISFSLSSQETPALLAPSEVPNVLHYERRGDGEPVVLLQGANLPMQMWTRRSSFCPLSLTSCDTTCAVLEIQLQVTLFRTNLIVICALCSTILASSERTWSASPSEDVSLLILRLRIPNACAA